MSGFDSPNFKKNIPSSPKPLREFNVGVPEPVEGETRQYSFGAGPEADTRQYSFGPPPPPQNHLEMEEAVKEARRQKLANMNKIGDAAKKRIELLADIGRLNKDVNIGGYSFSLRTLKAKETKEAALATFSTSITQLEASYEARKQQLARSIYKIDGEDLEAVLGTKNLNDVLSFIEDNLEEVVVEKLWNEYMSLKEESRTKYGINTTKEAEEVAEDLKK